jgi:hypothetical protein
VLEVAVPAGLERALAGTGEQCHDLADLGIIADCAGALSLRQELGDPVAQALGGLGDLDFGPGPGQQVEECREIAVHDTADPEVIVVEYELAGTVTTTGRRAAAPFIGVLRVRDGQVAGWREYQDAVAIAQALGQLPALLASVSETQA